MAPSRLRSRSAFLVSGNAVFRKIMLILYLRPDGGARLTIAAVEYIIQIETESQ
jgi:hypothetical protein